MTKGLVMGVSLFHLFTFSPLANAQQRSWTADNGNGTFTNPLFYDEFSDPDILRVGDDYYLAGTTMHTVPGLVILHSKDLVNWENISYCFDRFDFPDDAFSLRNHKEIYGQGIWAPAIRYANGQFYVFSNIRISADRGNTITCRAGSTTSACSSTTTGKYTPSMATAR